MYVFLIFFFKETLPINVVLYCIVLSVLQFVTAFYGGRSSLPETKLCEKLESSRAPGKF